MKKMMLIVLVVPAIAAGAWFALTRSGASDALGEWVARQVVAVAEAYIVPDVAFDGFRYRAPGTLELTGVTLTAPDGTEVVRAGLVRVTLAEAPSMNKPIAIEKIELKDATLRLLATKDGGFKGLVPFVEGQAIEKPESVDENLRLSRVFRVRSLSLENGSLEYDDGTGAPPMILSGLTLQTGVDPPRGTGGDEGWYSIDTETVVGDKSLAHMSAKGKLNIDSMAAKFERLALSMRLDESTYKALPPRVQQALKEFDARGQLDVTASGDVSLNGSSGTRLETKVALKEFNVASGEYRFPIDSAEFPISISEGRATMPEGAASLLGGVLRVKNLAVELGQAGMPTRLEWDAQSLDLQKMLRIATPRGEPPKLAGIVASSGRAQTALASPKESLSGGGVMTLREGRLIVIPMFKQMAEMIGVYDEAEQAGANTSTVDAAFDLTPAGIVLTETTVDTPVAVARGTGTIGFDGSLDLLINAGPMEKAQGLFGKLGEAIGKVTDKLMKYHITGRVGEPKVTVRPLGL